MTSPTAKKHKSKAPKVSVTIITLSDTRRIAEDVSGKTIREKLEAEGNTVAEHIVIKDEKQELFDAVRNAKGQAVITTGGTGLGPRDITPDTLRPLFDKELVAFSQIFNLESYKEIGTPALLSRACAGIIRDKVVFCLPGSPNAVKLGLKLLVPELGHIVRHYEVKD